MNYTYQIVSLTFTYIVKKGVTFFILSIAFFWRFLRSCYSYAQDNALVNKTCQNIITPPSNGRCNICIW